VPNHAPDSHCAAPWAAALRAVAAGRVVVLGIGNELRSDDGAGSLVAQSLRERFPDAAFDGGQAPENQAGPIRRAGPGTVIVVDAADFGGAPGEVRVASAAAAAAGGLTLGTHAPSIGTFMQALSESTGAAVHLVAIQAMTTAFGDAMTPGVAAAVADVTHELAGILEAGTQGRDR
jgi:hydrogenase 3 maturation protease